LTQPKKFHWRYLQLLFLNLGTYTENQFCQKLVLRKKSQAKFCFKRLCFSRRFWKLFEIFYIWPPKLLIKFTFLPEVKIETFLLSQNVKTHTKKTHNCKIDRYTYYSAQNLKKKYIHTRYLFKIHSIIYAIIFMQSYRQYSRCIQTRHIGTGRTEKYYWSSKTITPWIKYIALTITASTVYDTWKIMILLLI